MKLKLLFIVILFLVQSVSFAKIYKCKIEGRFVFSQLPCGDDAQELEVDTSSKMIKNDDNIAVKNNNQTKKYADTLEKSRLKRQYNREIKNNNKKIESLKSQKEAALFKADAVTRHSRSIYSVDEFKKIKSLQLHKITTEYNSKLNKLNKKNELLKEKLKKVK